MYVSVSLGIPYLWVDRHCIDQNDAEAKHDTISSMDSIYQCASLTIIAASGSGPDHGLPGVRGTRRRSSRLSGLADGLMAIGSPYTEIMDSMWNTRGWTYQEMFLSRRRLVFAESQMYFQCGTSDFQEIGEKRWPVRSCECSPGPGQGLTSGLPKAFPAISRSSEGLYSCLEQYYQRQLSFDTDSISAVIGVLNAFRLPGSCGTTHFYGFPTLDPSESAGSKQFMFLQSLSWNLQGNHLWKCPQQYSSGFPSWTWGSAKSNRPPADAGRVQFNQWGILESPLYQRGVDIVFTHKLSSDIKMQAYSLGSFDYEDFLPQLCISTWSIRCTVPAHNAKDGSYFSFPGFEEGDVRLDYPQTRVFDKTIAVYLGGCDFGTKILFLLVEKVEDNTYRRVGIYASENSGGWGHEEQDRPRVLQKICPSGDWQQRTIRLI
jgi:hypothetical protein